MAYLPVVSVKYRKFKTPDFSEKLGILFSDMSSFVSNTTQNSSQKVGSMSKKFNSKKIGTGVFVVIVLVVVGFSLRQVFAVATRNNPNRPAVIGSSDGVKTTKIDREFSFQAYDINKNKSKTVKYTITDGQLTNNIVVKGQNATAIAGREFFIINLKLVNDSNESLFINTRNYIRIQPKNSQDKIAPEIHNDTVEIQPLSTKLTRIGAPMSSSDRDFTLFVGELEGEKVEIPVSF